MVSVMHSFRQTDTHTTVGQEDGDDATKLIAQLHPPAAATISRITAGVI